MAFANRDGSRKFAAAIVEGPQPCRLEKADPRLLHVGPQRGRRIAGVGVHVAGRRAMDAKKASHATWDLMELSLHFAHRNGQEAMRLIEHIQKRHVNEPGVAEALTRMLVDVGLLNPDGTPAYLGPEAGEPAMAAEAAD